MIDIYFLFFSVLIRVLHTGALVCVLTLRTWQASCYHLVSRWSSRLNKLWKKEESVHYRWALKPSSLTERLIFKTLSRWLPGMFNLEVVPLGNWNGVAQASSSISLPVCVRAKETNMTNFKGMRQLLVLVTHMNKTLKLRCVFVLRSSSHKPLVLFKEWWALNPQSGLTGTCLQFWHVALL